TFRVTNFAQRHHIEECWNRNLSMKLQRLLRNLICIAGVVTLLPSCSTPQPVTPAVAATAAQTPAVSTPAVPAVSAAPATVAQPSLAKSDFDIFQGTWKGQEIGGEENATAILTVSGKNLEFHGSNPNDWYKGTFVLRKDTNPKQFIFSVSDCPA